MAQASEIGPLKRFAQGLLRNLKEVVNSFRYGVNNGKIESAMLLYLGSNPRPVDSSTYPISSSNFGNVFTSGFETDPGM